MKKLLVAVVLICTWSPSVRADTILDNLYGGFVGRAKLAVESTTDGHFHPEFLVNYFEIGKVNGQYIAAVDAGVLGELPEDGQFESANWTTGAKIHLAPLMKTYAPFPLEWQFLWNMEFDLRASYDWTDHQPNYGIVAAYPFK